MKIFGKILLINVLIYLAYLLLCISSGAQGTAAVLILVHAVALFIIAALTRLPNRLEGVDTLVDGLEEISESYRKARERRQALLISGVLVLLIGMPVCFFAGASGLDMR